jgi:tetratricopeptide (TPR) repeat protein
MSGPRDARRAVIALAVSVVLVSSSLVGSSSGAAERTLQNRVVESLEQYRRGDFDNAVDHLIGSRQVRSLMREFRSNAGSWIERASAPDRHARSLVAAALSVEIVAASFNQHFLDYEAARGLVEWSCSRLRQFPPVDAERWIHLAFIALAQGARDDSLLTGVTVHIGGFLPSTGAHAEHAGRRFPGEGRFKLAHVTSAWQAQQIATFPLTPAYLYRATAGRFAIEDGDPRRLDTTLRLLAALFDDPSVGPEARLRSGVLKFLRENKAGALEDLKHADTAQDPAVRSLAHLMLGALADQAGDNREASHRYRLAYEAVPSSSSFAALASRLYRSGLAEESAMLLRTFEAAPPGPDPWELYGQRDFRFFSAYREQVRREVAR